MDALAQTRRVGGNMKVLIIGAGGHGQCVADTLLRGWRAGSEVEALGFLDDVEPLATDHFAGLPLLGRVPDLGDFPEAAVVVAVGDNAARKRLFEEMASLGRVRATVIDPTAVIGSDVIVGAGSYVGPLSIIGPGCRLGSNVIVNGGGCIGHHSRLGDHVHIGPGVVTARGANIGHGAMVGAGTVIKPEVSIGRGSVVGAGSLVSRDLGEHVTAVGAPARAVRRQEPW